MRAGTCVCLILRLESSDPEGQLGAHGHEMDTPLSTVRCHTLLTFGLSVAFSNWSHILTLSSPGPADTRYHLENMCVTPMPHVGGHLF